MKKKIFEYVALTLFILGIAGGLITVMEIVFPKPNLYLEVCLARYIDSSNREFTLLSANFKNTPCDEDKPIFDLQVSHIHNLDNIKTFTK